MSDALTDLARDKERLGIFRKIKEIESEFRESPSPQKAQNLIELWKEYLYIPRGYMSSSNTSIAYEKIGLYEKYLKTGKEPSLVHQTATDENSIDTTVRIGNGFIIRNVIEDWLLQKIQQNTHNPFHKNFRIRLTVEEIEEVSCKNCPYLNEFCSEKYICKSKNLEELAERRNIIEKGKEIVQRGNCY